MKKFMMWSMMMAGLLALAGCQEPNEGPVTPDEPEVPAVTEPEILLTSPEDGATFDLNEVEDIQFAWEELEDIKGYRVVLSATEDFANPEKVIATENPESLTAIEIDDMMKAWETPANTSSTIYWKVELSSRTKTAKCEPRKLVLERRIGTPDTPYEERIADQLVIKVACVYDSPVVRDGKRLHEVYHWRNPQKHTHEILDSLNKATHGAVKFEIVEEHWVEQCFTYYNATSTSAQKDYVTYEDFMACFDQGNYDGPGRFPETRCSFDYVGLMNHYGFGQKRDAGEIHEVWFCSHPATGCNESRMIGKGAFWCNSSGIGTNQGAPCEDLAIVMWYNYERGVECALESFGHRVESIMHRVYDQPVFQAHLYEHVKSKETAKAWEKYYAHQGLWKKFEPGYAQVGLVHFPPNGTYDYDFANHTSINSYADEWFGYPYLSGDPRNARRMNVKEWSWGNPAKAHVGWMMYFLGHLPHFKGLNTIDPNDLHLNNWWHYVVNYNEALEKEAELRALYEGGLYTMPY